MTSIEQDGWVKERLSWLTHGIRLIENVCGALERNPKELSEDQLNCLWREVDEFADKLNQLHKKG